MTNTSVPLDFVNTLRANASKDADIQKYIDALDKTSIADGNLSITPFEDIDKSVRETFLKVAQKGIAHISDVVLREIPQNRHITIFNQSKTMKELATGTVTPNNHVKCSYITYSILGANPNLTVEQRSQSLIKTAGKLEQLLGMRGDDIILATEDQDAMNIALACVAKCSLTVSKMTDKDKQLEISERFADVLQAISDCFPEPALHLFSENVFISDNDRDAGLLGYFTKLPVDETGRLIIAN